MAVRKSMLSKTVSHIILLDLLPNSKPSSSSSGSRIDIEQVNCGDCENIFQTDSIKTQTMASSFPLAEKVISPIVFNNLSLSSTPL